MKRIFFKQNQYKEKNIMFLLLCSLIGIVSSQASYKSIEASLYEKRGRNSKLDGPDGAGSGFITRSNANNPPGSWPWVVSLGGKDVKDGHYIHSCTGAIVSNNKIMTTIGCLDNLIDMLARDGDDIIHKDKIYAKAGDDNLKVHLDDTGVQIKQLEDYVEHPRYGVPDENNYHFHNIAILTMKTSFEFDKYVRPIDLPAINEDGEVASEENLVNELLVFSDWGKDRKGKTMSSRPMIINPDEDCKKAYPSLAFPEELLCGVEFPSLSKICNVDYGTPIVKQDQGINRFVLKGFFSVDLYGSESCEENNNPNLIVPITSRSNIQFIYKQLYQMSFPELEDGSGHEPEEKQAQTSFPEDADLIYENCGRNSLLEGEPNDPKSQLKKYPWQVSIGYFNPEDSKEWMHVCGGSIVTRTKIITAAHCDPGFKGIKMSVRAGDDKLQNQNDDKGNQTVEAKNFIRHPKFNQNARYFDVGVMELKTPLTMTKYVRPICLLNIAEAKKITKEQEIGLPLTTTGWGKNEDNKYGEDLKVTVARVLTEEICNKKHEDSGVNKNSVPNLFTSDLLCASDPTGNSGVCEGDSGGPAAHLDQTKKRYYLRAIVSGSALSICGTKLFPNIYVRTADTSILSWILEQIKQKPQKVLIEGKTVFNQNQPIQYNCSADSYPVSDISWIVRDNDGNEIPSKSNGKSLEISSEEESDNLLVTCVANNFMGRGKATKRGLDDVIEKSDSSTALIMSTVVVLLLILFIVAIVFFLRKQITSCCSQPCGKKKFPSDTSLEVVVHEEPTAPLLPTTKISWKSETQKLAVVSHGGAGTWGVNDQGDIFQRSGNGNWKKVEGPKLMDISVGHKEIWGVDGSNHIYKLELINQHAKTPWEMEGEDFIQVSVSPLNTNNPDVWACDKNYKILHRQSKGEWLPIKTAPKVKMVTVGEAGVWIINDEDDVYYREGTYQKIENNPGAPTQMVPTGWTKLPEDKKFMWLASGEGIVWGINTKDELLYRDGISENAKNKIGTKWVPVKGVNGNFKQIDVWGKSLWGVNAHDRVYYSE